MDNKVQIAIREVIDFLALFVKTYLNIIIHPIKFLRSLYFEEETSIKKLDSTVFLLISTFFFVIVANLPPLIFENYFYPHNKNYSELPLKEIGNLSISRILFISLPLILWVQIYLYLIIKVFFEEKQIRKSSLNAFKYYTGEIFLSYFILFLTSYFFSNVVEKLDTNYREILLDDYYKCFNIIEIIIYIYLFSIPLISSLKGFTNKKNLKIKYLFAFVPFVILTLLNVNIIKVQNYASELFNPLKEDKINFIWTSELNLNSFKNEISIDAILYNESDEFLLLYNERLASIQFRKFIANVTKDSIGNTTTTYIPRNAIDFFEIDRKLYSFPPPDSASQLTIMKPGDYNFLKINVSYDETEMIRLRDLLNYNANYVYHYRIILNDLQTRGAYKYLDNRKIMSKWIRH